jgi:hypothetical protein
MIAVSVYVLCAATALACAVLLTRGYLKTRTRLQFWSGVSFAGLTLANVLLVVDLVIVPQYDLALYRSLVTLASAMVLLYSLISETTS